VKHAEKATALAKGARHLCDDRKPHGGERRGHRAPRCETASGGEVLKEIAPELSEKTLVISVAASVPTSYIDRRLGGKVPWCARCPTRLRQWDAE